MPATLIFAMSLLGEARALIVGNIPGTLPGTTVNPAQYSGWTQGDPGWDNVSAEGSNYVYLGDGWVLSARHVGYNSANGVRLQSYNSDGSPGPVKQFSRIFSDYYFDYGYGNETVNGRQYAVSNPATIQSETGGAISLAASNEASNPGFFTDLQLFRISEDPGLPALTIASAPTPQNYIRSNAPEVVYIGRGQGRVADETHWNVTGTSPNLIWTETTGTGTHQGYERDGVTQKYFGTNRLADIRPNSMGDPTDNGAINYTQNPNQLFQTSDVVSDSTGVFPLQTADGVTRDIISMITSFDKQTTVGNTPLETQAAAGNSGSSVFYNRNGEWELAGIVHAISTFDNQPGSTGVYGNTTIVSDLWYYMQDYEDSIFDIMRDHTDYSHQGDINLNGTVTGNGTGSTATDDISAFVAGWGFDNGLGVGNVESWKKGDLNRDGKTNVHDFLKLRRAFNEDIPDSVVTLLFGPGGGPGSSGFVPEPTAAALFAVGALLMGLHVRHRRA